jgi:hypothetical protein
MIPVQKNQKTAKYRLLFVVIGTMNNSITIFISGGSDA